MKKALLLLGGLIFFIGCSNRIDPTPGDKCRPRWYNKKTSDTETVYGFSVEKSRSHSLASTIGLASAQSNALQQINVLVKNETGKQIEEKMGSMGGEMAETYNQVLYQKLKIDINQPCFYCYRDEFEECEDDGYLVVYTRVKVDVEKYLNQNLRDKMGKLLEKPEEMMNEIKGF